MWLARKSGTETRANLKAVAEAGHEIANHSYTHPHLKTLKDADIEKEMPKAAEAWRTSQEFLTKEFAT